MITPEPRKLLVLSPADCLDHITASCDELHQEGPDRVEAILDALRAEVQREDVDELCLSPPALPVPARTGTGGSAKTRGSRGKKEEDRMVDVPLASLETVTSVHSKQYIKMLSSLGRLAKGKTGRPLSPVWRRQFGGSETGDGSMTRFSAGSYRAALRAAGAVCLGVDLVMRRDFSSVFCNVRPPGHHAGPNGYDHVAGNSECLCDSGFESFVGHARLEHFCLTRSVRGPRLLFSQSRSCCCRACAQSASGNREACWHCTF